jgi:hypothetical protein
VTPPNVRNTDGRSAYPDPYDRDSPPAKSDGVANRGLSRNANPAARSDLSEDESHRYHLEQWRIRAKALLHKIQATGKTSNNIKTRHTTTEWDEWERELGALDADLKGLTSAGKAEFDLVDQIQRAVREVSSKNEAHFAQDARRHHEVPGKSDMRIDPATRNAQKDVEEPGTAAYGGNDSPSQNPAPRPPVAARHRAGNDRERKLNVSS